MKHQFIDSVSKVPESVVWVLPFFENEEPSSFPFAEVWKIPCDAKDFQGKEGELFFISGNKRRFLLVGLGVKKSADRETWRRAYGKAVRFLAKKRGVSLAFVFPKKSVLSEEERFSSVFQGVSLANYTFLALKSAQKQKEITSVEQVYWVGISAPSRSRVKEEEIQLASIDYIRDLVNGNADQVHPEFLGQVALAMRKISSKVKVEVWEPSRLEKEGMGLLLAVGRAGRVGPRLIQVSYRGGGAKEAPIVFVGKGVTYDTGGLSLKTADGMVTMKCDMAGGATALGIVKAAAELGIKKNVVALVPAAENGIGETSYKPGDVYRSYSGKSVEILNTDAEGRLILADALAYAAEKLNPKWLISLATLTGAALIALGEEIAPFFSNDPILAKAIQASGKATDEMIWELPLYRGYKESLRSQYGDLVNTGGREAGSMKAALFLQEFVGEAKWAHLDIAGPAFFSKPKYYHTTSATGFGLRLFIDLLREL